MTGSMRRVANGFLRVGAGAMLIAGTAGWGPHGVISDASVEVLDPNNPLVRFLGPNIDQIGRNGFLADHYRNTPNGYDRDGNGYFKLSDYMRFRGADLTPSHMPPGVYQNYAPYFRRALLYLRTESPAKAARQVAALSHFFQDNGSPPHALGVLGHLHYEMEHGIRNSDIRIRGYRPRLLGTTESAAITALVKRCHALEEYSTIRAMKMRTLIQAGRKGAALPYMLECALECARVGADVLHTLGYLLGRSRPGTSALAWPVSGRVITTWSYPNGRIHGAVDIAGAADAVTVAARRGKVLIASTGKNHGFGNYVRIGHVNGYTTDYHHFKRLLTVRGRAVECMTHIGTVGSSGTPTVPQVHFELRRYGTKIKIPAVLGAYVRKGEGVPGSWPAF